jgi:histidine ammonia-lyase
VHNLCTATELILDGEALALADVVAVATGDRPVRLGDRARARMASCRAFLERLLEEGRLIYGVSTGTGPNVRFHVEDADRAALQRHVLDSLRVGWGEPLSVPVVRAMMLLRAHSIAQGHSGARVETAEQLLALLNAGITPVVPACGSVGASGDLVPLSHMVQAMEGQGEVVVAGRTMSAAEALASAGMAPWAPAAKEGLALVNGTACMTAIGVLAWHEATVLLEAAVGLGAIGTEALLGTAESYAEPIQALRPHPGQLRVAAALRERVAGSRLLDDSEARRGALEAERAGAGHGVALSIELQEPYSLRCIPQWLGAVSDAIDQVGAALSVEANGVSDNPLFFPETGEVLHGGNFQGLHVAMAMDQLALAASQLAVLSERRLARLVEPAHSRGLTPYLTGGRPGLDSGLMGLQLATTALVAEGRARLSPASALSISTNGNNQDVVSMGTTAARKAAEVVRLTRPVLAAELLASRLAADQRGVDRFSPYARAVFGRIGALVAPLGADRPLAPDVAALEHAIMAGVMAPGQAVAG